jgi:hypothetical protein
MQKVPENQRFAKFANASGDPEWAGRVLQFAAKSFWDKRLAFGGEWMNGGAAKPPARANQLNFRVGGVWPSRPQQSRLGRRLENVPWLA